MVYINYKIVDGKSISGVFLDFRGELNILNHDILFQRLPKYS